MFFPSAMGTFCVRFREGFLCCHLSLLSLISEFRIHSVYLTQCSPLLDRELLGQKCLINLYIQRALHILAETVNIFISRWKLFCFLPKESSPTVCCCGGHGARGGSHTTSSSLLSSPPLNSSEHESVTTWQNPSERLPTVSTWTSSGTGNRLHEIMR